jgi:hypothetical protein
MVGVTRGNRALLWVGGLLMTASIVTAGVFASFVEHSRVLVVTMDEGVTQAVREALRAACGGLPGVTAVADKGNPDPSVQARFPVRFDITDATTREEAALNSCVEAQEGVRGFLVEGDR